MHLGGSAIRRIDEIFKLLKGKRPAVFLDYDGTLTEIAEDPEKAVLGDRTRIVLEMCKEAFPTGIISGRDLENLLKVVGIKGLAYAGSHGFEIMLRDGRRLDDTGWRKYLPDLAAAERDLELIAQGFEGARVERKKYSVALHYRKVDQAEAGILLENFEKAASKHPMLKKCKGKKVVELLPNLDWDKGKALSEILSYEGISEEKYLVIFIGDDITDESAFEKVKGIGLGILVGDLERPSAANYRLSSPSEVSEFLKMLVEFEKSKRQGEPANKWA